MAPNLIHGLVLSAFLGCDVGSHGKADAGSNGGAGGSAGTITVTGTLMTNSGERVKNAPVGIGGHWTTSDDMGSFTIADVIPPYDLMSVVSSPRKIGVVYKGLTRPDPTILFLGQIDSTTHSGTVTGNISGGDGLPAPNDETRVSLGGASSTVTTNPYSLAASWPGPTVFTGTLRAVQYVRGPNGTPAAYKGFGERGNVSVVGSSTVTGQDLVLAGVSTANLTGTVVLPSGYALDQRNFGAQFADGYLFLGSDSALGSAPFNLLSPSSIGATISILLAAAGPDDAHSFVVANGLAPGASGVTLTVQAAPVMTLPAANGTCITAATDFVWTRYTGGVHMMYVAPMGTSTGPDFYIFTADTTGRIPDLAAQGLGLPAVTDYKWNLMAFAPYATLDAFATQTIVDYFARSPSWHEPLMVYSETLSDRPFTTK